jgi:hypothetical protein
MKQFEVKVNDDVGSLEKVTEALAKKNINIVSISSERIPGQHASLKIVTDDEDKTEEVMNEERFIYRQSEFIMVKLSDQPGELLRVTKVLRDADINIETLYLLNKVQGMTDVAMIVNKMDEAKVALKQLTFEIQY